MWSLSLTLGSLTQLFRAGTELHATELCSLEQELKHIEQNYVLWSKSSTLRKRFLLFGVGSSPLGRRAMLLGSGTHLNAEELCSLEQELNHGRRTLFLGAGTHLNEEEPCFLEQELNY